MNYKVKAYHNRFRPASIGLVFSKSLSKRICFDYSCKYDLKTEDQLDINKLFGVGYWPHHHQESARFGWRWNESVGKMEIFAYVYSRGKRISKGICMVSAGVFYQYHLLVQKDRYVFVVVSPTGMHFHMDVKVDRHCIGVGYKLGAYFGGNLPAPKEMTISTKRIA